MLQLIITVLLIGSSLHRSRKKVYTPPRAASILWRVVNYSAWLDGSIDLVSWARVCTEIRMIVDDVVSSVYYCWGFHMNDMYVCRVATASASIWLHSSIKSSLPSSQLANHSAASSAALAAVAYILSVPAWVT